MISKKTAPCNSNCSTVSHLRLRFLISERNKRGVLGPVCYQFSSVLHVSITSDNNMAAAAARFFRAKLSRLSFSYIQKSRPFITTVFRLSLKNASRWRRFYLPRRKSLHWGFAVGTTGVLCGGVAFCAASSGDLIDLNKSNSSEIMRSYFSSASLFALLKRKGEN